MRSCTTKIECCRVSLPWKPVLYRQNKTMAGRPRKDPTGHDLVNLNFKVPGRVREVAKAAAADHGTTVTDYLIALILNDNPRTADGAAGLQEVLLRKTA